MTAHDPPALDPPEVASTGIPGLDAILLGGFPRDEVHLVQGSGGTGKTTLALQFLIAGSQAGETGLYITLSQTKRGLETIARSHGFSLDGLVVEELSAGTVAERAAADQTVLHTSDLELGELTRDLCARIDQIQPRRVIVDSIGVIRLLAGSAPRFHREVILLRQFLARRSCTVLFLDDGPAEGKSEGRAHTEFHNIATSVVHLDQIPPEYGEVRRRIRVVKVRGVAFQGGYHNFRIRKGGLQVFPRLGPTTTEYNDFQTVPSGLAVLDHLLGGGLEQGTACLFVGPPGTGKSTLASIFCRSEAERGDVASIFLFDERPETFAARAKGLKIDLAPHLAAGRVLLKQLDTSSVSAGEFADQIREAVVRDGAKIVVIDSLTGYFNAMGESPMLLVQMHELLNFLSRHGVLTLLLIAQQGFMTVGTVAHVDVSYLSDSIIVLRSFVAGGKVRRCLAAVKKRQGEHETTIRELFLDSRGVRIGETALRDVRHVLGGTDVENIRAHAAGADDGGGDEPGDDDDG